MDSSVMILKTVEDSNKFEFRVAIVNNTSLVASDNIPEIIASFRYAEIYHDFNSARTKAAESIAKYMKELGTLPVYQVLLFDYNKPFPDGVSS
jgi:hypothetical protein